MEVVEDYKKVSATTPRLSDECDDDDDDGNSSDDPTLIKLQHEAEEYEYAKGRKWWSRVLRCNRIVRRGFNLNNMDDIPENEYSGYREGWEPVYRLIFETSTIEGQLFDLALLVLISISVTVAVLDSIDSVRDTYGPLLLSLEVIFTLLFTIECSLRIICVRYPREYCLSMMGIVDASSIVPTYLAAFIPSARPLVHLAVLRALRVLRVFRILKLVRFYDEAASLAQSLHDNRRRVAVFLFTVFTLILVIGCAMYLIEGERNGFSSIPISLYWTVVTLTTVGYGDIAPRTVVGQCLATFVMLAGYGIIACPLVLTATQGDIAAAETIDIPCPKCFRRNHTRDSNFCRICGTPLRLVLSDRRQPRSKSPPPSQRPLDKLMSHQTKDRKKNRSSSGDVKPPPTTSEYDEIPL